MNTAVILNQSSLNGLFQTNEWRGGHHYPIYPYSVPIPGNLLPIAGLKQFSSGKSPGNKWTHGVYSQQIPIVSVFNRSHVVKSAIHTQETQHASQNFLSTNIVPQISNTAKNSNRKTRERYNQSETGLNQNLPSGNPPQFSTTTESISKSTAGHYQSAGQNVGGFLTQNKSQQDSSINLKLPSNPIKFTELLTPKQTRTINSETSTVREGQRDLFLTRKRSSTWPSRSGISKKKPKDDENQADQINDVYKNLEMDVANILISDIPFPVVSQGSVEKGEQNGQVSSSMPLKRREIIATEKPSDKASFRNGDEEASKQARITSVGSENHYSVVSEIQVTTANLLSREFLESNKQAVLPAGSEKGTVEKARFPILWGAVQIPNTPGNNFPVVSEGISAVPDKQASITSVGGEGILEPQAKMTYPVGSDRMIEKQGDTFNSRHGEMPAANTTNIINTTNITNATNITNTSLAENGGVTNEQREGSQCEVTPEKHSAESSTGSDTSFQSENEKENYCKNLDKVVFTCQQCVVTFETTKDLIAHTATHSSNNFSFKCNVCTQVFRSTNGLQKHIEFHADHHQNFQCSFCFHPMSDRDSLEEHIIASHMSKRPHKCSYCPKAFRDPGSLQKHIRIHTGERPYKCTACDKSFAEYSSLRKHYRVHTGEQPYQCQYCPKAFSISGNLQRHILIHTGERPYRCSKCSKTFNNPSHLRRHEKNLHSKLEVREK